MNAPGSHPFSSTHHTAKGLAVITLLLLPLISPAAPGGDEWRGDSLMDALLPPDGEMMPPPPPRGPHPAIAIFDTDRSGDLSPAEVSAASSVLAALDADGDGVITDEEARVSLPPPPRHGPPPFDPDE